jgi:tRNA modification GTPase
VALVDTSVWINHLKSKNEYLVDLLLKEEVLREGASVAIAGIPNVGKSSLLNRLLGEERAIVTDIAGTTRDSIEESLELDGVLIRIWDTAGIVNEADSAENSRAIELPEQMGIKRSWKLIERADLVLFLFDAGSNALLQKNLFEEIRSSNSSLLLLGSKKDIHPDLENDIREALGDLSKQEFPVLNISSTTGEGIEELKEEIVARVCGENQRGDLLISSERHYLSLKEAYSFLENAQSAIKEKHPAEYISFEIRQSLLALQEIVGVTNTEDILGRIFSKFCIGK